MISFEEKNHEYKSINPEEALDWISATSLISVFHKPFDPMITSAKVVKNKKSKWYGMTPEAVRQIWKNEAERATKQGTWYHTMRENTLLSCQFIERKGFQLPVIAPLMDSTGKKIARNQKLEPGIYPEHMVYLRSESVCGQIDLPEVIDGMVDISDYKTNKEIKEHSYVNWEGLSEMMLFPLSHLQDCNMTHYNLQVSLYMYIILKHNPHLKPGKLQIHHVTFEEEEEKDEYGYPIAKLDRTGNPIVKDLTIYNLPYMKAEVQAMLKYYNANKATLKKKKK